MSYGGWADSYDLLTSNVNYAGYAGRLDRLIKDLRPETSGIVELACGTFSLGLELIKLGYSVIGTDISEKMLEIAEQKCCSRGFSASFYNFDMRDFELPKKGEAFVCSLDGFNHLDGMGSVAQAFRAVRRNIVPGGLFIFDMNTPYKHRCVLGDNSFIYERRGVYCGWQNEYRESDCSVLITLDIFAERDGRYVRHSERFREYAYPERMILNSLRASGFEPIGRYDGLRRSPPGPRTERILYVARSI